MIIMLIIKCTFRATEESNEAHFINPSFYRVGHKKKSASITKVLPFEARCSFIKHQVFNDG